MSDVKANQLPQYVASVVAAIGSFQLGILLGWSNPVQEEIEAGNYGFSCSKEQFSWISSSFVLGCMCICMPVGCLINQIGRKWTMIVMSIPFLIGWCLLIFAKSVIWMYLGRFVLGIGGGAYCVAVPVYIGEIAQKEIRGLLGTMFQLLIVSGILYVWSVGAFLSVQILCIISAVFPILMTVLMLFMPESPTYLIKKGNMEGAYKSFTWLRGKQYDSKLEVEDIKTVDAADKANPVSIGQAIKRPETIRAFVISSMLMILQQLCGINVVIFYSTDVFKSAGSFSPRFSTILLGIVKVLAVFIALFLMDRLGRRSLLLISGATNALCTFCLGVYFYVKVNDPVLAESLQWLPLASTVVFVVVFCIGYGPIPWLMLGEIFSTDIKGPAGSLSAAINWLFTFVVTKTFVNLRELLGAGGTFMLFTGITIAGIFFIWFVVIETKGKSLNEIQAELSSKSKQNVA